MQHELSFVQDTSREAFAAIQPHLSRMKKIVMAYASERGPEGFSDGELAERHPELGYNIRSIRCHLTTDGLIVDTGVREKRPGSTRRVIIWSVA